MDKHTHTPLFGIYSLKNLLKHDIDYPLDLSDEEIALIEKAAALDGMDVEEWIRLVLIRDTAKRRNKRNTQNDNRRQDK